MLPGVEEGECPSAELTLPEVAASQSEHDEPAMLPEAGRTGRMSTKHLLVC